MAKRELHPMVQRINAVLVRYPRFEYLLALLEECRELSDVADEPQCMALEGDTGAGKSTMVKTYWRRYPRTRRGTETHIPVLYLWTPSPATVTRMLTEILRALGDPGAETGDPDSKEERVRELLDKCGVELIILDDFHNLIDSETDYVLGRVSNWLKALIKRTGKPFVVVGITGKVKRVLQANAELSRLFAVREPLDGFRWSESDQEICKEMANFVSHVEHSAEIQFCPSMARRELLKRMHYATNGVAGNLMNLMRYAVVMASKKDTCIIDLSMFAIAFRRRLAEHLPGKENPFLLDPGEDFVAPEPNKQPDPPGSVGKRSRRRKDRQPSASDVLRTA